MTLKTLRARLLLILGELVKSKNRPTIKLPANFLYKDTFEYVIKKIEKSDTPRKAGGLMSGAASKAVDPIAKRRAKAPLSCPL